MTDFQSASAKRTLKFRSTGATGSNDCDNLNYGANVVGATKALGISQGDVIAYLAAVADLKLDFERQLIELKKNIQDQDDRVEPQKTAV